MLEVRKFLPFIEIKEEPEEPINNIDVDLYVAQFNTFTSDLIDKAKEENVALKKLNEN